VVYELPDNDLPELRINYINRAILRNAQIYGIAPILAFSVAFTESGMNEFAISPKGAVGLFQHLMRDQAELVRRYLHRDPSEFVWHDAEDSSALGCAYLAALIKRFGEWGGVAAYNCGPTRFGGVEQFKHRSLPDETWQYTHKVFGGL
jgi:soluble lytic murein transglycosylase-like protein